MLAQDSILGAPGHRAWSSRRALPPDVPPCAVPTHTGPIRTRRASPSGRPRPARAPGSTCRPAVEQRELPVAMPRRPGCRFDRRLECRQVSRCADAVALPMMGLGDDRERKRVLAEVHRGGGMGQRAGGIVPCEFETGEREMGSRIVRDHRERVGKVSRARRRAGPRRARVLPAAGRTTPPARRASRSARARCCAPSSGARERVQIGHAAMPIAQSANQRPDRRLPGRAR